MIFNIQKLLTVALALFLADAARGQGEDSTPAERDLMVIAELLAGGYTNANQAYFDFRVDREPKHRGLELRIDRQEDGRFGLQGAWSDGATALSATATLAADNAAGGVGMRLSAGDNQCRYLWRREAAQFRATTTDCESGLPGEFVLSERQLWMSMPDSATYELHRVRDFKCYADMPGVGGGRDIPYERYGEFEIHDQGGSTWFTSKEGREIGISLLLVDWPINNYEGVFTRDSLVIYLSEKTDGERQELGYAFTRPDADRIGLNLKWILAMCYITSNRDATPSM